MYVLGILVVSIYKKIAKSLSEFELWKCIFSTGRKQINQFLRATLTR